MKSGCLLELAKKDLILPNKKQLIRVAESGSTMFNVRVSCLRVLICSNYLKGIDRGSNPISILEGYSPF